MGRGEDGQEAGQEEKEKSTGGAVLDFDFLWAPEDLNAVTLFGHVGS